MKTRTAPSRLWSTSKEWDLHVPSTRTSGPCGVVLAMTSHFSRMETSGNLSPAGFGVASAAPAFGAKAAYPGDWCGTGRVSMFGRTAEYNPAPLMGFGTVQYSSIVTIPGCNISINRTQVAMVTGPPDDCASRTKAHVFITGTTAPIIVTLDRPYPQPFPDKP